MKLIYCIITHRNTAILREFIKIMSKSNEIYLHIDKKSKMKDFKEYENIKNVNIIKKRINVKWGSFSQVKATLLMLNEIEEKDYDYVSLVSGDCLPTNSDKKIKDRLKIDYGKEFIGWQKSFSVKELNDRVKYKYLSCHYKKTKNNIDKKIINIHHKYRKVFINKSYKFLPKLYKGNQWFTISKQCVDYILEYLKENKYYIKAFKKSLCSDEMFFQTIIFNSKFREKVYMIDEASNSNIMSLRYIDWNSGPEFPKLLDSDDFIKIKNTGCILARKFNPKIDLSEYEKVFEIY